MGVKNKQKSMGNITTKFPGLSNSYVVKAGLGGSGQVSWLGGNRGQAKGGAEGDKSGVAAVLGVTENPLDPTPDSAQADTILKLGRSVRTATDFVKTKGRAAKELLGG
jgi:hypothetical protein